MKAALALFLCAMVTLGSAPSLAQQPPALSVKPVVEKKLKELPPGCRVGDNADAFIGGFRVWDASFEAKPSLAVGTNPQRTA